MKKRNYPWNHAKPKDDNAPIEDVYGGPEPDDKPSPIEGVYAGPDFFRRPNMGCVYAGPEYFNPPVTPPPQSTVIPNTSSQVFQMVYAAPCAPAGGFISDAPAPTTPAPQQNCDGRYCANCGMPLLKGAIFCHECGTPCPKREDDHA